MKSKKELFSVENEIAVHSELPHESAQSEKPLEPEEKNHDSSGYYMSVAYEPTNSTQTADGYRKMLQDKGAEYSSFSILLLTIVCGVLGGVFAVPGVFLHGNDSFFGIFLLVVFGPFIEETLKQSGIIFQMEKLPATIRGGWQFFLAAALGGTMFGLLENVIYKYLYLRNLPPERLAMLMSFRWTICTAVHIACTLISAMGLRRVWRTSLEKGMPCQIEKAFPWFVMATCVHGTYNLTMLLFGTTFFGE